MGRLLKFLALVSLLTPVAVKAQTQNADSKLLDIGQFSLVVPSKWKYVKAQGEDSFVGNIQVDSVNSLTFDLGPYSNNLDEDETTANFKFLRIDGHKAKLVTPKNIGQGVTGVYFENLRRSKRGGTNFQISGRDLSKQQQQQLVTAIKTLRFKLRPERKRLDLDSALAN